MNKQEQQDYMEKYKKAKEKGVPFFPDIIFKDTVVSLIVLIILIALAYFFGAPMEARADPNDTNYIPRPEWYFLFLFQMLKYFPGSLEVVGAMILPGLFITLLLLLPFIDKSPRRHFLRRPFASMAAVAVVLGIGGLTFLAMNEAPPPIAVTVVDKAAALYTNNCANCHGSSITVPEGTDLHTLIATGNHQGMPAWGGDLSADELDMLVGFILSPNGSALFTKECSSCHKNPVLASGNLVQLQRVFDEGKDYQPHIGQNTPDWKSTLTADQQNALLNFLAAPDGQRLFAINCSGCHGQGVGFNGTKEELRGLIFKGGHELKMPAWKGTLSAENMNTLADFVVTPDTNSPGSKLFGQHCTSCHGDKVPTAPDKESAIQIISLGGSHITMPVWGDILTVEQLDALTTYTWETSQGLGVTIGAELYAKNCVGCHGKFGEGGPNPTFPGDMIFPISSSGYLRTRDNTTIRNIIIQGQPDYGMTPFGSNNGGSLSDEQINAIVEYVRSWEANPPEVAPPRPQPITSQPKALSAKQIYDEVCAQCHGANLEGTNSGPALSPADLRAKYNDQALHDVINNGVLKVAMPGVGKMFTEDQVKKLTALVAGASTGSSAGGGSADFASQILPIFTDNCLGCHNGPSGFGGWDASSYNSIMTSGKNGPQITAGKADNSPLMQLLQATSGTSMPPSSQLPQDQIQVIKDWINAGASEKATGSSSSGAGSASGTVSFANQVLPIFQGKCIMCHGPTKMYGGWDGSSYQSVMTSGDGGPKIIAGDASGSPLMQLLQATNGVFMPPTGQLSEDEIQIIMDWINAGALDN